MGFFQKSVIGSTIDEKDCKALCRIFKKAKERRFKKADIALALSFVAISQLLVAPDTPIHKPLHAFVSNMTLLDGPAEKNFGRFLALKYGWGEASSLLAPEKVQKLDIPTKTKVSVATENAQEKKSDISPTNT